MKVYLVKEEFVARNGTIVKPGEYPIDDWRNDGFVFLVDGTPVSIGHSTVACHGKVKIKMGK